MPYPLWLIMSFWRREMHLPWTHMHSAPTLRECTFSQKHAHLTSSDRIWKSSYRHCFCPWFLGMCSYQQDMPHERWVSQAVGYNTHSMQNADLICVWVYWCYYWDGSFSCPEVQMSSPVRAANLQFSPRVLELQLICRGEFPGRKWQLCRCSSLPLLSSPRSRGANSRLGNSWRIPGRRILGGQSLRSTKPALLRYLLPNSRNYLNWNWQSYVQ